MLEKTLESPLDCKEIQPVHSKGDQSWVFFRSWNSSTLAISCKELTIGKDSDAGRDWRQEEKGTTEDEMAGWHHRLYGCEFEWTPGDGDGQGGLACCDSWGRKESDMTGQLNWTELKGNLFLAFWTSLLLAGPEIKIWKKILFHIRPIFFLPFTDLWLKIQPTLLMECPF